MVNNNFCSLEIVTKSRFNNHGQNIGEKKLLLLKIALHEVSIFGVFLVLIPRIQSEYGEILSISPYSVRMQGNMDQQNSEYERF